MQKEARILIDSIKSLVPASLNNVRLKSNLNIIVFRRAVLKWLYTGVNIVIGKVKYDFVIQQMLKISFEIFVYL